MYKRLFLLLFFTNLMATATNSEAVLRSVEHSIPVADSSAQLEIGSLRLFFDEIPEVQYLPQRAQSNKQVFFFPHTKKDRLLKDLDSLLQNKKNDKYTVNIASVTAPIEGTTVTFNLDNRAMQVVHMPFDTIEGRKGIIFRLFNNKLLDQLYKQEKTILHTAAISS